MSKVNALVALGGGPSPVINSSLLGVVQRCLHYNGHIAKVYAARHGIEGVLQEELIDMGAQDAGELELLRNTPASGAIGTCRYKLDDSCSEDFSRIIDVLRAHDIGYFFYIGGNDSMDTADKVSKLAKEQDYSLVVAGVPKTIDNDIGDERFTIIDHTPGYASAARYWASIIQNTNEENKGMCVSERVSVFQAMGRKSGYITAAARLADPNREMPLQLYFAESHHNLDTLTENVDRELLRSGRCIVVVNEGFDVGSLGEAKDGFGHVEYGASQTTAAQVVVNHLNKHKFPVRGTATGQVPGILQRSTSIYRSKVDIQEAYEVGAYAVDMAMRDGTGFMSTILREPGDAYKPYYSKVDLRTVANSERHLPKSWITPDGIDVTDDFLRYAMPLIGDGWPEIRIENGLQRFARLDTACIDRKTKAYVPFKNRAN
jgi:ATP-dependent phosphofructokinase / diphosphate-dependent phosphofructokinase